MSARHPTILHVSQPGDGGVATCVRHLAEDQVRRGWRVAVACPESSTLARRTREAGAEVVAWEAARSPGVSVPGEIAGLRRVLGVVRPDLVHLHSSKAGLVGRLAMRRRRPTVFQPHSWSFDAVQGAVRLASLRWERLGARWADAILCVSDAERDRGVAHGIRAHYRVVPNGVAPSAFPEADDDERRRARDRLQLGPEPLTVCVGRLTRQKGQDILLDAWPSVRSRVPNAALVLVGTGEEEEALRARAVPGVTLVGQRDDVSDWLAAADVVAMPSRWEGMSLGLLEAMARGRSVVAADVPGAREALAGTAGAVVPIEDVAALAEALVERLEAPELRVAEGRAGAARARQQYDLRVTLQRTAELYADVLETRAETRR